VRHVYVHDLVYRLGSDIRTVQQSFEEGRLLTAASQFSEAGFARHHMCSPNENAYDLAKGAVSEIKSDLKNIDSIIYATCLPLNGNIGSSLQFQSSRDVKYLMDYPASHLQADFNMEKAAVIGLNQQACTSMLGSLRIARSLILAESDQNSILCVTADRFPKGAIYEQAYNLISDGAAACIVGREEKGYRLLASHALTNGALAQATDDETVGSYFSYTHRLLSELFEKSQIEISEIDWIVPQNTNVNAWVILSRLLGTDYEKVYFKSIQEVGHIISSDNIVNLARIEQEGLVKSSDKLLLFMAGFGLNWQAIILEKV
jgi:3-oxoacyl-[acyl-carrier-protein] synthase-3